MFDVETYGNVQFLTLGPYLWHCSHCRGPQEMGILSCAKLVNISGIPIDVDQFHQNSQRWNLSRSMLNLAVCIDQRSWYNRTITPCRVVRLPCTNCIHADINNDIYTKASSSLDWNTWSILIYVQRYFCVCVDNATVDRRFKISLNSRNVQYHLWRGITTCGHA